jgi:hypothetical protein
MLKRLIKPILKRLSKVANSELNYRRFKGARLYGELVLRQVNDLRRLQEEHADLLRDQSPKARWRLCERQYYSQNGEDGLLLHLFTLLGAPQKNFIEFGIEDGVECNAANLAINFGWHGLFLEGSASLVERAREFYHQRHRRNANEVKIACQFVTAENVNQVFRDQGFSGDIDLLSIDIDGCDYWIWKAIEVVHPRLVVIEYNACFGPEQSITVKYDPAYDRYQKHPSGWYHGASLTALTRLARAKGYLLACCDSAGANAIFVRRDLAAAKITELSPAEAFYPSVPRLREKSQEQQWATVKDLEFETVNQP